MNIADPFLFYAKLSPGALAIGVPGAARPVVSYGLLVRMVNNVGKTALAWGLVRGQVVGIHVKDKIFHAALILGLARVGIVTLSARNTQLPKELGVHAVITDAALTFANAGRVMVA
jgi:acyl-CoA synthetase (AMP-forming)/AMP-acid ligase II